MYVKRILILLIFLSTFNLIYCQEYWEVIYENECIINSVIENYMNYIFLGTEIGLYVSYNNGTSWEETGLQEYCGPLIVSDETIYASTGNGIYISVNNGLTWEQTNFPATAISIFKDSYENLFAANWGHIYKSTENGNSWNIVLSTNSNEIFNDFIETSGGLFAASQHYMGEGGLYRSLDQGDNWELIGLNYHFLSSLAENSNGELFAGSRGHYTQAIGGVYRSSDNGETWETLTNQLYVTDMVIDSQDRIFVGCNEYTGFVWMSEDNGETWNQLESQIMTTAEIKYLTITEDDYLFAISYGDYPINKVYRSLESTKLNENTIKINSFELSNFPNPFNPITTISFNLIDEHKKSIKLEIFNLKGQKIKEFLIRDNQSSITWDGTNQKNNPVSSGVYLYKIKADNKIQAVNKCLLLK